MLGYAESSLHTANTSLINHSQVAPTDGEGALPPIYIYIYIAPMENFSLPQLFLLSSLYVECS